MEKSVCVCVCRTGMADLEMTQYGSNTDGILFWLGLLLWFSGGMMEENMYTTHQHIVNEEYTK